jgi:hypothetical protein
MMSLKKRRDSLVEIKKKEESSQAELNHFLFIGGTGGLSAEDIREYFSKKNR